MFLSELESIERSMLWRSSSPNNSQHLLSIGFRMIDGSASPIEMPSIGSAEVAGVALSNIRRRMDRRDEKRRARARRAA